MNNKRVHELIGVPYVTGGRGLNGYDCYGLIIDLLKDDGIEIPDYKSPEEAEKVVAIFNSEIRHWKECELRDGAVLLFRVPGNFHVGYYLGKDMFIHTWKHSGGVIVERFSDWKRRLVGIYEYVG